MIIHVFPTQIQETNRIPRDSPTTILMKGMRRRLEHNCFRSLLLNCLEPLLKRDCVRRGVQCGNRLAQKLTAVRPETRAWNSCELQDMLNQIGGGSLPTRAGHADHLQGMGRVSRHLTGHLCETPPCPCPQHLHPGDPGIALGEHFGGATLKGFANEQMAIMLCALECKKNGAWQYFFGICGDMHSSYAWYASTPRKSKSSLRQGAPISPTSGSPLCSPPDSPEDRHRQQT